MHRPQPPFSSLLEMGIAHRPTPPYICMGGDLTRMGFISCMVIGKSPLLPPIPILGDLRI
jgi:hypothetical protein